jgi:hypothetical protein
MIKKEARTVSAGVQKQRASTLPLPIGLHHNEKAGRQGSVAVRSSG